MAGRHYSAVRDRCKRLDSAACARYGAAMPEDAEIIATLTPSPVRRWLAIVFTGALGAVCFLLVLFRPPAALIWIVPLLVLGVGTLWLSRRLTVATRTRIELTAGGLRDGTGRVVAPIGRIAAVERGAFALKPSNGFLVRLSEPAAAAWQPGLWWRVGRRVGVGGVTPSAQGRMMADALAALLAMRDRDGDA